MSETEPESTASAIDQASTQIEGGVVSAAENLEPQSVPSSQKQVVEALVEGDGGGDSFGAGVGSGSYSAAADNTLVQPPTLSLVALPAGSQRQPLPPSAVSETEPQHPINVGKTDGRIESDLRDSAGVSSIPDFASLLSARDLAHARRTPRSPIVAKSFAVRTGSDSEPEQICLTTSTGGSASEDDNRGWRHYSKPMPSFASRRTTSAEGAVEQRPGPQMSPEEFYDVGVSPSIPEGLPYQGSAKLVSEGPSMGRVNLSPSMFYTSTKTKAPGATDPMTDTSLSVDDAVQADTIASTMATVLNNMQNAVELVAQRDLFHQIDESGRERLTADDITSLAHVGHWQLTESELSQVVAEMNLSESGSISITEFRSWWRSDSQIACRVSNLFTMLPRC